jgi:thiamine kinase-like enzyme
MTLSIDEAIKRVPQWRELVDWQIVSLPGGITNLNYRVDSGGEAFVVRVGGADSALLGINRNFEREAHQAAAVLGIAPEVVYFIEPEGYLVTRFIHGRALEPAEMGQAENMARVTAVLQQCHALPAIDWRFSPFRTVETYAATARRYGVRLPDNFGWFSERLNEIEQALDRVPFTPCLCHNDLLNANFLDDGRIRILDWEYAGMGDVCFDLANFAVHHEFEPEQDEQLLSCYFGERPSAAQLARHQLLKIASDFREAMWGMVQVGISQLDFDFRGYARHHFDRMEGKIQSAAYQCWLQIV